MWTFIMYFSSTSHIAINTTNMSQFVYHGLKEITFYELMVGKCPVSCQDNPPVLSVNSYFLFVGICNGYLTEVLTEVT